MPFLLVSAADVGDARAALAGGAHIIDAKDPTRGVLGAVGIEALARIAMAAAGLAPVSAALGDLCSSGDDRQLQVYASHASALGLTFLKVGVPVSTPRVRAIRALQDLRARCAATARARVCAIVLAAYADGPEPARNPYGVIDAAHAGGAAAVLLDTQNKDGRRRLFDVLSPDAVAHWVTEAHSADLQVAIAGSLRLNDIATARDTGADVIGVRGAACGGDRTGRVSATRVRALRDALELEPGASPVSPQTFVGDRAIPKRVPDESNPWPSFL